MQPAQLTSAIEPSKKKGNKHKKGGYFRLTNLNQSDRIVLFAA